MFTASLPKQKHSHAKFRQVRRLTARRKNHYHDFVTYPEVLSNCIAWTSAWVNQKGYVTNSFNVTHDEKDNYHDFVTYPEVLSNCIAWTSAWVNQKGYVTNSFNVTHDEKDNYHDFVTYPEVLSNCIAWTSAWVDQKGYVTSSYNVTHDEKKNSYHDFVTLISRSTQQLYCMDFSLGEPERTCNKFL